MESRLLNESRVTSAGGTAYLDLNLLCNSVTVTLLVHTTSVCYVAVSVCYERFLNTISFILYMSRVRGGTLGWTG